MTRPGARAASLAVALAAGLSMHLAAQPVWTELRGDRFVLRGQFDAAQLRQIACDLETAARVVGIAESATATPPADLSVLAVGSAAAMRELLPQFWERRGPRPLAAYWAGLYGHHIAVRIDARRDERLRRMLHEVAHFATHVAHAKPPRWLDEGLSELWEHTAIEDGQIAIGRPIAGHVRVLRSDKNWIPLADLISATSAQPKSGSNASAFYAQSWALVHYLLFEKSGGRLTLEQLPEPDDIPADSQLRAYIRGKLAAPVLISTGTPISGCEGQMPARTMPVVESLVVRARALADGERPDAALTVLDEALRRHPGNVAALETLGFVHFLGNRSREAAAVFDRLISEGGESHVAYYYRALLAAAVPVLTDGSGRVPELEYVREAVRLSPGFLPARDRLQELLKKFPLPAAGIYDTVSSTFQAGCGHASRRHPCYAGR